MWADQGNKYKDLKLLEQAGDCETGMSGDDEELLNFSLRDTQQRTLVQLKIVGMI
jgi:hypothetical protein